MNQELESNANAEVLLAYINTMISRQRIILARLQRIEDKVDLLAQGFSTRGELRSLERIEESLARFRIEYEHANNVASAERLQLKQIVNVVANSSEGNVIDSVVKEGEHITDSTVTVGGSMVGGDLKENTQS